jgi:RNA polymerase sigma-70 factor (ECF subfamily)
MDDDRRLVDAYLRHRGEEAFLALYRRHAPAMYQLIVRLLGHARADAEDVLQEAWIRAAARLDGFRWQSALRTWLCGIAANCCRERMRRAEPLTSAEPERALATQPPRRWDPVDLERALARLPAGYRAVLVLHDLHGYTHEEIARLLDVEAASSRSQLSRARKCLRSVLEPELPGVEEGP